LQLFQWSTDLATALGGELQASVLPFPPSSQTSLGTPSGIVGTWDVTCVNCKFTVDLSPLAPQPNPFTQPSSQSLVAKLLGAVEGAWGGVQEAWGSAVDLFTGGADGPTVSVAEANLSLPTQDNPAAYMNAGEGAPPLITDYYFRLVPKANGQLAGAATNSVRIRFYADEVNLLPNGIIDCSKNPEACASPGAPRPYIVEVLSYHGIIHPIAAKYGCYLATKEVTIGTITYPEGKEFCPPEDDDSFSLPDLAEAIVGFVVDAINWASQAYADLKAAVVDFVAQFVPSELCGNACLSALLDAGLAALGIPPSVPNFDQLMDQGIEYMASQAVEQIGVPPAVSDLGSLAEEQWKDEMQGHFEDALAQGVQAAQEATSKSVSYIPDGVPVKPHPQSGYQPASMLIQVTRDPLVPAEADTCSSSADPWKANLLVLSNVTQLALTAQMQTFNDFHPGPDLVAGPWAYLFEQDSFALPALLPGESVTIPIILKPIFTWGQGSGLVSINDQSSAWSAMYLGGQAQISISNPCATGATLETIADGAFPGP
jgi:hypothetical protein